MIHLKSSEEIQNLSLSGAILGSVLRELKKNVKTGTVLKSLDDLSRRLILKAGAKPAFLGYRPDGAKKPYPAAICASINEVIVHGLPTNYKLKDGDILKIDLGVKYRGAYTDAAITIGIGKISKTAKVLIKATQEALNQAIKIAKPGHHLGDIGWIISKTAQKYNLEVVKGLTGHGVGSELHEEPTIYNYGKRGEGPELKPGMVLAIEPMFAIGTDKIIQRFDESWATTDSSLSAHFEHTIAITSSKPQVLTK